MIPVARAKKPRSFDAEVKVPGDAWLANHPAAVRPPTLWTPYTSQLSEAFSNLCGYAAMHDPTGGTVDHFLSFKNRRDLAYDWSNYRFASGPVELIQA